MKVEGVGIARKQVGLNFFRYRKTKQQKSYDFKCVYFKIKQGKPYFNFELDC